jgi:hypothetical protein
MERKIERPTFTESRPADGDFANPPPAEGGPVTRDESTAAARVLFDPTVRRMKTLALALVSNTASGDFAIFAPLAALHDALSELSWDKAPRAAKARTYLLASVAFGRLSELYRKRVDEIREAGDGGAALGVPSWGAADTLYCYDEVEKELPTGVASPPDADLVVALLLGAGVGNGDEAALVALVDTWTEDQRFDAEAWCMNVHARAEGQKIEALPRPAFIPEPV